MTGTTVVAWDFMALGGTVSLKGQKEFKTRAAAESAVKNMNKYFGQGSHKIIQDEVTVDEHENKAIICEHKLQSIYDVCGSHLGKVCIKCGCGPECHCGGFSS